MLRTELCIATIQVALTIFFLYLFAYCVKRYWGGHIDVIGNKKENLTNVDYLYLTAELISTVGYGDATATNSKVAYHSMLVSIIVSIFVRPLSVSIYEYIWYLIELYQDQQRDTIVSDLEIAESEIVEEVVSNVNENDNNTYDD